MVIDFLFDCKTKNFSIFSLEFLNKGAILYIHLTSDSTSPSLAPSISGIISLETLKMPCSSSVKFEDLFFIPGRTADFRKDQTSNGKMTRPVIFLAICSIVLFQLANGYKEIHGLNGKLFPKAATFNFPEYAYKETSKNVSPGIY